MSTAHRERHMIERIGWLRAAVLGANDGIISTASLILGVALASGGRNEILIAGAAALVAGAMSMAAGEYVSVSSQADVEKADLAKEKWELENQPESELRELTGIYVKRGLEQSLAEEVARQLTDHDPLAAHARDELGMHAATSARPIQAAIASALMFASGAAIPMIVLLLVPLTIIVPAIVVTALVALALLGALGAGVGGSGKLRASLRVVFWGALAMAITSVIGSIFGRIL